MRKLALSLFIVALLSASSEASFACSCEMPTVAQALNKSKAVFLGEVVAIDFYGVVFKVKRSWKGADDHEVKVFVKGIGTSCDPGVEKGATMLIYAYRYGTKIPLMTSYCFRTRAIRQPDDEVKELDEIASRSSHMKPNRKSINRTRK
jgi:hypothetical protein